MAEYREGVRRRLTFQDADSSDSNPRSEVGEGENITNSLLEQMRVDAEDARTRWNFDFEKEEPLPGRWQWVKKGEPRFESFGAIEAEDNDEYFLANDHLINENSDSNDVFVDASNSNINIQTDNGNATGETIAHEIDKSIDNNNTGHNNN